MLTVTDNEGCSNSAMTSVNINEKVHYYFDSDNDGFGIISSSQLLCNGTGNFTALTPGDCNDNNAAVHPNASETCNTIDDDCDGLTDDDDGSVIGQNIFYSDADGDGYGTGLEIHACFQPIGTSDNDDDNDDSDPDVHPGAQELCNEIDDNGNGIVDEGCHVTLNLKVFLEGFYSGSGIMRPVADPFNLPQLCDVITVELHHPNFPYDSYTSINTVVNIYGSALCNFNANVKTHQYYIVVKHRNSISLWSKEPYDFSTWVNYFTF
jgi:hypothetical protein